MNKAKNIILLVAAIVALVVGVFAFIAGVVALAEIDSGWSDFWVILLYEVFIVLSSIALIIFGAVSISAKRRAKKPLNIIIIALAGFMLLITIIYMSAIDPDGLILYGVLILFGFAVIGLYITGMVLPNTAIVQPQPGFDTQTGQPLNQYQQPPAFDQKQQKIEFLKKLKDDGQITEEQYNELLMKELES